MNTVQPIRSLEKIELMKMELMRIDYKYYMLFTIGINTGYRISDLLDLKVKHVKGRYIDQRANKTGKESLFLINDQLREIIDPYIMNMKDDDYLFESQKPNDKAMTEKQYQMYLIKKKHPFHPICKLLHDLHQEKQIQINELLEYNVMDLLHLRCTSELEQMINQHVKELDPRDLVFKLRPGKTKPVERIQAYKILNKAASKLGLSKIGTHSIRKTFGYWHYKKHKRIGHLMRIFQHSTELQTLDYCGITQDDIDSNISEFHL